ncbi:hypothetical protein WA026_019811 [Henosepilachna vigintioctopunctata]|uniref:Endonuclease/exonuclease/phosphatase domain-containing protein n=1 Tax=Henosepilachna vigintioctopunctata TaxID=420089 RepID=A0AAW1VAY9_9CUCU
MIINIYNPPDRRIQVKELESIVEGINGPYMLLGDLDAQHQMWGSGTNNSNGYTVAEFLDTKNLCRGKLRISTEGKMKLVSSAYVIGQIKLPYFSEKNLGTFLMYNTNKRDPSMLPSGTPEDRPTRDTLTDHHRGDRGSSDHLPIFIEILNSIYINKPQRAGLPFPRYSDQKANRHKFEEYIQNNIDNATFAVDFLEIVQTTTVQTIPKKDDRAHIINKPKIPW